MSDNLTEILNKARLDALLKESTRALIELEKAIIKSGDGEVFVEMDLSRQLKFAEATLSQAILASDWVAAGGVVLMLRGIQHLQAKESQR